MTYKERLLHYVWKFRLFSPSELKTSDGQCVEIIDAGLENTNAGPDFFNAKIRIGEKVWAGNVEMHTASSEWMKHGHHTDKNYNSVILHVVERIDKEVFNERGLPVAQLQISVSDKVRENADYLLKSNTDLPCRERLSEIQPAAINAWFNALGIERLERKTNEIFHHLERFNKSWEQSLYVLLSRNYGFGLNSDEFERLALSLPFNLVLKHSDNLFQIEALLFGQAGMLNNENLSDDYCLQLKKEYDFLSKKYQLKPLNAFLFKNLRARPNAFPQSRIAQLAALLKQSAGLFSTILETEDYWRLRLYFQVSVSDYWKTHYSFGKSSAKTERYLGDASLDILLINTVAPVLFAYGTSVSIEKYCERALNILESVKPERNSIVSTFRAAGLSVENAFRTQAMIQLRKEYCDKRRCLHCRIGYTILSR